MPIPDCQAAFFDLSSISYLIYDENYSLSSYLRNFELLMQKKKYPVFAFLRSDLLKNELLYIVHKAIIFSDFDSEKKLIEEKFADSKSSYTVSVLNKPGSGKLELDDRFEFSSQNGFKIRKDNANNLSKAESNILPSIPSFNISSSNDQMSSFQATILVEDSDRDSEDEMDADSNF